MARGRRPISLRTALLVDLGFVTSSAVAMVGLTTVLITAGPTFEALDPIRGITNHSSGKMGFAIARAAREAGADVTLVAIPAGSF